MTMEKAARVLLGKALAMCDEKELAFLELTVQGAEKSDREFVIDVGGVGNDSVLQRSHK
jgi:hypothetical protein